MSEKKNSHIGVTVEEIQIRIDEQLKYRCVRTVEAIVDEYYRNSQLPEELKKTVIELIEKKLG